MLAYSPPTSQKSRPISFVLNDLANGRAPVWVPLVVRPEDLTRNEPSRATLHQTLGRDVTGWVDNFGPGLPSISIAGHTGWRAALGQAEDGAGQFEKLHSAVFDEYHRGKQRAIDIGIDPGLVKLLFVDELDRFAYEVMPVSFTLRRSKSRPLLMQYNIQLQAVSTTPVVPFIEGQISDLFAGLESLGRVVSTITGAIGSVVSGIRSFISPITAAVRSFLSFSTKIFSAVNLVVGAVANGTRSIANDLIGIARGVAAAGKNAFDTIAAVKSLPGYIKHTIKQVAGAYRTAFCLLSNSLKAKGRKYPDYSDLYGSSNCSSTTGGRPESPLLGMNVFNEVRPMAAPVLLTPASITSLTALASTDPVIAPMPPLEVGRNLDAITSGFSGFSPDFVAQVEKTTGISGAAYA